MNSIYYMVIMGVKKDYRGRGIAGNMARKSLEVAKTVGCEGAYVTATNGVARKIFNKIGMNEVRSLEWDNIAFQGELPCRGKDFGSNKISSHFLLLKGK